MFTLGDIARVIPNSQFSPSDINTQIFKIIQELEQHLSIQLEIQKEICINPSTILEYGNAFRKKLNNVINDSNTMLAAISTQFGPREDVDPLFKLAKVELECNISISQEILKYLSEKPTNVYQDFDIFRENLDKFIEMNMEVLICLHSKVCYVILKICLLVCLYQNSLLKLRLLVA